MAVAIHNYPQVECEVVTDFARLESIAPDWQRLWMSSPGSEIFQNFGWSRAYWKAYGDQLSVFAPVVYRDSQLIGILPLALRNGTLQFLGAQHFDYNDVICKGEDLAQVMHSAVQALLDCREHWENCVLENVPAHSRLARYLSELRESPRRHFRTAFRCPCPTIVLGANADLAAKLARKDSLRRHENQLRRQGQVTFRHLECRDEIERHMEEFFAQHIARRAIAGDASHCLEPRVRTMFQALARELDPHSLLRFSVLAVDDRPVAYHFGFQANQKLVIYQLAFNVDYWKSSPGEALFRHLLLYAREHNLSEVDLTRGGEGYKDRFANQLRANVNVYFSHDLGVRRRIQVGVRQADGVARTILESLRRHPPAYRFARASALRCIGFWRSRLRRDHKRVSHPVNAIGRAVRAWIYDRVTTLTFVVARQDVSRYAGPPEASATISPIPLSDLAMISATCPDLDLPLCDLQNRIAAGQQLYVVRQGQEPVQVWSSNIVAGPAGRGGTEANGPKLVWEQCWTAPWSRATGVFKAILRLASDRNLDVMVSCRDRDQVSHDMRLAGLRAMRRTMHFRLLHWFRPVLECRRGL